MAERAVRRRAVRQISPEDLVLGLGHEVGNILAGIRLGAHLVARRLFDGDVSDGAARTERETTRAGAYLGQMRPLLVTTRGRRPRVPVQEVLGALDRSLGAAAGGPRQLAIRTPRGVADLLADPDALHHVLVALVLCAADATPDGGKVCVSARESGPNVVLRIEDDGGPLEAGPPPGQPPRRGRPLVLAAAAQIARRQGGRLTVTQRPAKRGTRVEIALLAVRERLAPSRSRFARPGRVR